MYKVDRYHSPEPMNLGESRWAGLGICNPQGTDRYRYSPPINAVVAQRKSIRLSSGRLGCRDSSAAPNTKSIQDKSRRKPSKSRKGLVFTVHWLKMRSVKWRNGRVVGPVWYGMNWRRKELNENRSCGLSSRLATPRISLRILPG